MTYRSFFIAALVALVVGISGLSPMDASGAPSTTGTQMKLKGMIEPEEDELPTTGSVMRRLTPLEKHRARKGRLKEMGYPTYNPYLEQAPPQTPGAGQGTTTAPETKAVPTSRPYSEQGPGPIENGQVTNLAPSNQVVGACNAAACHPTNAGIMYAAFVNGGIWKTMNATAASPSWVPQTDGFDSLSVSTVVIDPTDATGNTLVAGSGRRSSFGSIGGARLGILRTTDGGANWNLLGTSALSGKNVISVVPRGNTIVVAVSTADSFLFANIGIFRSTNAGASFTKISGTNATTFNNGLPGGRCYDLAGDPANGAIIYAAIRDASANNGVYKSTDTGLNWERVSNSTMNSMISDVSPTANNVKIACGTGGSVFVAVSRAGRLTGVFRSGNGGTSWTQMDLPGTMESGVFYGIHPGGQGGIHFSLAADPTNPNIVYIGGDRQPAGNEASQAAWPNSIGAADYVGRLFRGNASQPSGAQWVPMTHSSSVAAFPGGGAANGSAPHADSRGMVFDAIGRLIESNDGGVYCRTSPQNNLGVWQSLIGDLRVTEVHDVAYDSVSNKIVVGTQDTGTPFQTSTGNWSSVSTGDGGDVAVDDISLAANNQSIRYTSFQNLSSLRRRTYNASGVQVSSSICTLTPLGSSPEVTAQFYTPIKINKVVPARLAIGAGNGIYESMNQGVSVNRILSSVAVGDGLSGSGLAYGGKLGGVSNPDVVYGVDGNNVYVRTTTGDAFSVRTVPTDGDVINDVVLDPENYNTAYIVATRKVFKTTNAGVSWTNITGNLTNVGNLRCIEFIIDNAGGAIAVGGQNGVHVSKVSNPTDWTRLGTNMPKAAYVYDMEYDSTANILVAGTLGRGVWLMPNASVSASVPTALWEMY